MGHGRLFLRFRIPITHAFGNYCARAKLIQGELDPTLVHGLPQVDQSVAHAAKSGVDAHSGFVGDFLETHVPLDAHFNHQPLFFGQGFKEVAHVLVDLLLDHAVFHVRLVGMHGVEHIKLVSSAQHAHFLSAAEMVNAQVVRDAQYPRQELSFLVILSTLQCVHHLDERVLEQVVCQVAVTDDEEDFGIHLLLMAIQKGFERSLVPREVQGNQLLV